ncbi:MAG: preprotein translocase subunit SecG [Patescibacteria group bacterium]|nr:preprotein translocase subunit SecG [Patescibacteria group bacterium]
MQTISTLLPWIQIILAVLLMALILLQQNDSSLGGAFGGADSATHAHRKRGAEKFVFNSTILVAILFVGSAILALFV